MTIIFPNGNEFEVEKFRFDSANEVLQKLELSPDATIFIGSNSLTINDGASMFIVPYTAFDFVACRIREEEEK